MTPYRTTPPPATGSLIAWDVAEGAAWPGTPQFYYTWWVRYVEQRRKTMQQTRMGI